MPTWYIFHLTRLSLFKLAKVAALLLLLLPAPPVPARLLLLALLLLPLALLLLPLSSEALCCPAAPPLVEVRVKELYL